MHTLKTYYLFVYIEMACIGIDLGTTYCCVADIYKEKVRILHNKRTPSFICFKNDGTVVFAKTAKDEQRSHLTTTFYDIKRIIGRTRKDDSVQELIATVQYCISNQNTQNQIMLNVGKNKFKSPEEISGLLLAHLKQEYENRLGKKNENVVITVPTHFNNSQRMATIEAGKIAGFSKVQLLNEPTAAVLEYGFSNSITDGRVILVYNFGGGSFDVSIIKCNQTCFEVLAVDGINNLGGRDITHKLFKVTSQIYNMKFDSSDKGQRSAARLLLVCETAKFGLSRNPDPNFELLYNLVNHEVLDRITQPLLDKTIICIDNCLAQDKVNGIKIDEILLVGGSSKFPKIRSMLKEKFNMEPKQNINPDESIAAGAAIYAAKIYEKKFPQLCLTDVCSYSLWVETVDRKTTVIIPKHTVLPATISKLYKTCECNQNTIEFKIYFGNPVETENSDYIELLKISSSNCITLKVTYNIDISGIVNVTAEDEAGKSQYLTLNIDTGNYTTGETKNKNQIFANQLHKLLRFNKM